MKRKRYYLTKTLPWSPTGNDDGMYLAERRDGMDYVVASMWSATRKQARIMCAALNAGEKQ